MFKPGDIVRHKASFLKSAGWYLDVPINGIVVDVEPFSDVFLVSVDWSNGTESKILSTHLLLKGQPDYSGM